MALLIGKTAMAATEEVTANIAFDTPLSITVYGDPGLGTVRAGVAEVYSIHPDNGLTAQNSSSNILYGWAGAADMLITGSTTASVQFSVANYTADNGVTPSNAVCNYADDPTAACDGMLGGPPGGGTVLFVGVTLTVDGTQTAGETAEPTFDLTVIYQ